MAIKDCWFFNGQRAREVFGWVKKTDAGRVMDEIDDIFQPLADDIQAWAKIQDIGSFSPATMKELKDAWAVIPSDAKKILRKALEQMQKVIDPKTLVAIIELYLKSVAS